MKAQWGLADDTRWWSSAHVGTEFQFGHESTHIGDEFTLGALRVHPTSFIRVNVSYEYYDVGGPFDPNDGRDGRYQSADVRDRTIISTFRRPMPRERTRLSRLNGLQT